MSQQLKIADFENASVFGTVRDEKVTPYICPPEVAAALCKGDTSQLKVSGAEDVWAVGVMVLRLLGLREPFLSVGATVGDSSKSKLATISKLSYSDVSAVLRRAGVAQDSELESFLIGSRGSPGCLAIEPQARATVSQLLAKGWISGGHHTQLNREGADAVREIASRMDAMQEDINDLGVKLQESLEEKIQEAREAVEVSGGANGSVQQVPSSAREGTAGAPLIFKQAGGGLAEWNHQLQFKRVAEELIMLNVNLVKRQGDSVGLDVDWETPSALRVIKIKEGLIYII